MLSSRHRSGPSNHCKVKLRGAFGRLKGHKFGRLVWESPAMFLLDVFS